MRLFSASVLAGVLLLVSVSSSELRGQPPSTSSVRDSIPFELRSGFLIVVPGQIGAMNGLRFILDTGATRSAIDQKLARKLHQPQVKAGTFSFDGVMPVKITEVSDVSIGSLHIRSLPVLVMKLADVSSFTQDIDGIIGMDILDQTSGFTIDYQAKTVSFHLAEGQSHELGPLVICLNVQGVPVDLVVDTGFPGIVLYRNKLHARIPGLQQIGGIQNVMMGPLRLTSVRLSGVGINGVTENRDIYFLDEAPRTAIPGIDGVFGPAELKTKRLEFDLIRRRLRYPTVTR